MSQLVDIKQKLASLKKRDAGLSLFGANKHRYSLQPPLREHDIRKFEQRHTIVLPQGYVQFLTGLGNGGAGPFYGLERLGSSLSAGLDPSIPFPHTQPWNQKFQPTVDENDEEYEQQLEAFEEDYFSVKHLTGVIAICDFGCAVNLNLVVNGAEYGNIWTDDRASDYGIYPSQELGNEGRIGFLDWYEKWLDNSLASLAKH